MVKDHIIDENKKTNTAETIKISSMNLDCSGAGVCQPQPVEAEVSDIQPAYPSHKLEKAEEKAAHEVKKEEHNRAVRIFEKDEDEPCASDSVDK